MKIIPYKKGAKLAELLQDVKVKMSFASVSEDGESVKQLHEWVQCRDFLGDVVLANNSDETFSVYNFVTSKEKTPINKENTTLLIKFPSIALKNIFLENYKDILHVYEYGNGTALTEVIKTNRPTVLLVKADAFWQSRMFLISFYTYLIKVCSYKYIYAGNWKGEIRGKGTNEANYYNRTERFWDKIFFQLKEIASVSSSPSGWNKLESMSPHAVHDQSGFVSLASFSMMYKGLNVYSAKIVEMCE